MREQEVIRLALGLPEGEPMNYPAIGSELGIGGERVRQIRNVALKKLKQARNPDWPWPKGQAPEGWLVKDALDAAGFSWPGEHDWPPDQLPPGHDLTESVPTGAGLKTDEIVPGVASLRIGPVAPASRRPSPRTF